MIRTGVLSVHFELPSHHIMILSRVSGVGSVLILLKFILFFFPAVFSLSTLQYGIIIYYRLAKHFLCQQKPTE